MSLIHYSGGCTAKLSLAMTLQEADMASSLHDLTLLAIGAAVAEYAGNEQGKLKSYANKTCVQHFFPPLSLSSFGYYFPQDVCCLYSSTKSVQDSIQLIWMPFW